MIKLILVFIIACISLSNACSCIPIVKNKAYCSSAFAGTIKVLNSGSSCGTLKRCYSITVVQQFRGAAITPTILETASQSAACGVTLVQGHTYFVATNPINSSKLGLNLCQLKEDWTSLSICEFFLKTLDYIRISCASIGVSTDIKAELAARSP